MKDRNRMIKKSKLYNPKLLLSIFFIQHIFGISILGLFQGDGKINEDSGSTDIYIYPPFEFRIVDSMITNFHLPRSTLLVMVSAFAGRDMVMKSYEEAKEKNYRFYSFGDCMLIKENDLKIIFIDEQAAAALFDEHRNKILIKTLQILGS